MTVMGGQQGLRASASGTFSKNMLVRMDEPAAGVDLNTTGEEFTWSYSTDGGSTWVTAQGPDLRRRHGAPAVPGGYMDLDATTAAGGTTVPAGRAGHDPSLPRGSEL